MNTLTMTLHKASCAAATLFVTACLLAPSGELLAAFDRRGIPLWPALDPGSAGAHTWSVLPLRVLPAERITGLGATRDFYHGLRGFVARAQAVVGGVWEIKLDTQTGETIWTATFEQDGATLSGEVDIGDRMILPLTGTVDGAAIAFEFIVPDLDGDMPINLSGEVEGTTIRGDEGSFIWYGAGRWTGRKHRKQ